MNSKGGTNACLKKRSIKLLMLYNETKAFDNRVLNDGPFCAAGAGDLSMVLINGAKVLFMKILMMLSLQKLTDQDIKMIFCKQRNIF